MIPDLFKKFLIACFLSLFFIIIPCTVIFSQTSIKGRIINIKDGKPVAFATISINKKRANTLSDKLGNFAISLLEFKNNDSLFITSVGFKNLYVPLREAINKNEFALYEQAKDLQTVIVRSFMNEAAVGSKSEISVYFRSWGRDKPGGEIGKIFNIDQYEYKPERVRFKVNNYCDTCSIRLHIREVAEDGWPGKEILTDSIAKMVYKLSYDDKFTEFDLRPYEVILKEKKLFVSLEILNCSRRAGDSCSLSYIGTEEGDNIYKAGKDSPWETSSIFSIYLKLFYKY